VTECFLTWQGLLIYVVTYDSDLADSNLFDLHFDVRKASPTHMKWGRFSSDRNSRSLVTIIVVEVTLQSPSRSPQFVGQTRKEPALPLPWLPLISPAPQSLI
jgi:hypothetical protein